MNEIKLPKIFMTIWSRWKEVILICAAIRIGLLLNSLIITSFSQNIFDIWNQWDGPHYLDIAKYGYQTEGEMALYIVFYPLYPILIKFIGILVGDFTAGSVLISIFFSFTASILLYELALLDFNKKIAVLSVWFLNIFPTSYFLQTNYTESLFLTMSLSAIYFYRKQDFYYSGIFGFLSSLTRINGVLLLPFFLLESKINKQRLLALILTPLGFLIYLGINYYYFNNPFHFNLPLYSHWHKHLEFPWVSIGNLLTLTIFYPYYYFPELLALLTAFIVSIRTYFEIRKSYGIYLILNLLLFTSTSFIQSTPRYILIFFPMYFLLAQASKPILILTSVFFLILLTFYTSLYVNGGWAF